MLSVKSRNCPNGPALRLRERQFRSGKPQSKISGEWTKSGKSAKAVIERDLSPKAWRGYEIVKSGARIPLSGCIRLVNAMNEDRSDYVLSVVESQETSASNAEQESRTLGSVRGSSSIPPSPQGYEVIGNWAN